MTGSKSKHPLYRTWRGMMARCELPSSAGWRNYGARGITVCDRWRGSFDAFVADMGTRPTQAHTVERLDNDGPYAPDNCVWATPITQARNKRTNVRVWRRGRLELASDLAKRYGLAPGTVLARLRRRHGIERALWPADTKPILPPLPTPERLLPLGYQIGTLEQLWPDSQETEMSTREADGVAGVAIENATIDTIDQYLFTIS